MLTQMTMTFAPDGMSGSHAPTQGRFDGSKREHAPRQDREPEAHDHNDHGFDDGLVHSHPWASTSYSR